MPSCPAPSDRLRPAAEIAAFALQQRLPTVFGLRDAVLDGGLISYAVRNTEAFCKAADYVAWLLLHGAKPADLPVEQPTYSGKSTVR